MSSSVSPVPNTTVPSNTTTVTKSKEQILIQSSGAMIAIIVTGIIIILAIVLIVLKTYNRRTHASRVLGARGGSKPRPKMSQSTAQGNMPLNTMRVSSVSGSIISPTPASESGFQQSSVEGNHIEQFSTTSDSSVITIHDAHSFGNT
ncbi:noncompact myelin-associated protein [Melanotaenia boesemani]|uniref:noncompact myelin-associated protein n=1 Tax=Melanotaenia boesemani TaxID=1250792 RepID=UPI001C056CE9|nr:noncompact myelin-associated protein [Melanotaenia boesemani]XP_041828762.1 noncompact myelin-associated protein [Melanotaenia boesemani]